MSNRIRQMRLKWLWHALRMKDDRLTKGQPEKIKRTTKQKMDGLVRAGV